MAGEPAYILQDGAVLAGDSRSIESSDGKTPPGSADALKQYGVLDAACRTKAAERDEVTKQVEKLKAETATLQAEKQRIQAAREGVAKAGQRRVQSVEKIATGAVNSVKDQQWRRSRLPVNSSNK